MGVIELRMWKTHKECRIGCFIYIKKKKAKKFSVI
jgi:hypothetical protein